MKKTNEFDKASLEPIEGMPLLLNVDTQGQKLYDWLKDNKQPLMELLQQNGALLIRGLRVMSSKQFAKTLECLFGEELSNYSFRSTPRTKLRSNIYTASEYHSSESILQHNENSYTNKWAMKIGFLCTLPAESGGNTPISDSREIYRKLPKELIDKFEKKKILYVRNYTNIDLPWSEVFQTDNKQEVEDYCKENDMTCEWLPNNGLRTKQVNQATAIHPVTGDKVWFNQAHLFHITNLKPEIQDSLLNLFSEDGLPRNTYYGDGSQIEPEYLQLIRETYEHQKISFPWEKSDILLLDNMLFTHGREPFSGDRQVLVGMADVFNSNQLNFDL